MKTGSHPLVVLNVAVLFTAVSALSLSTWLDLFVGKDLWAEHNWELQVKLEHQLPLVPKGEARMPSPWRVWKVAAGTRYLVLRGESLNVIPSGSWVSIQLFDGSAGWMKTVSFRAGWRILLVSASLETRPELAGDCFVIHSQNAINGAPIARQYYVLKDDEIRLVRLEDREGKLVPQRFIAENFRIGPVVEYPTLAAARQAANSDDFFVLLPFLIHLGGHHGDAAPFAPKSSYFELVQIFRSDPEISDRLDLLAKSPNAWVREAASAAIAASRTIPDRPVITP